MQREQFYIVECFVYGDPAYVRTLTEPEDSRKLQRKPEFTTFMHKALIFEDRQKAERVRERVDGMLSNDSAQVTCVNLSKR